LKSSLFALHTGGKYTVKNPVSGAMLRPAGTACLCYIKEVRKPFFIYISEDFFKVYFS